MLKMLNGKMTISSLLLESYDFSYQYITKNCQTSLHGLISPFEVPLNLRELDVVEANSEHLHRETAHLWT